MKLNKQEIPFSEFKESFLESLSPVYSAGEALQLLKILMPELLGVSYAEAIKTGVLAVTSQKKELFTLVQERLLKHEPYQYILNKAWFYDLEFFVNQHVLIPRPETEELVDLIVKKHKEQHLEVLDIGTGSGCIAITLAKQLQKAAVYALDVSKEALQVAKQNAYENGVSILFKEGSILEWEPLNFPSLDIIVSNPPYIPIKEKDLMHENVLAYEPHLALFVENKEPLIFYQKIAQFALKKLKPKAALYVECNEYYALEVAKLYKEMGLAEVEVLLDLQGKNRIVSCTQNFSVQ